MLAFPCWFYNSGNLERDEARRHLSEPICDAVSLPHPRKCFAQRPSKCHRQGSQDNKWNTSSKAFCPASLGTVRSLRSRCSPSWDGLKECPFSPADRIESYPLLHPGTKQHGIIAVFSMMHKHYTSASTSANVTETDTSPLTAHNVLTSLTCCYAGVDGLDTLPGKPRRTRPHGERYRKASGRALQFENWKESIHVD